MEAPEEKEILEFWDRQETGRKQEASRGSGGGLLCISRQAIRHNFRTLRCMTEKRLIIVVKENGYGLGLENLYGILKDCGIDFYAAGSAWEALELRRLGFRGDILLLTPELSAGSCRCLIRQGVSFMLGSAEQAEVLKEASAGMRTRPRVHLKIDTGLGRYGFGWDSLQEIRFCTLGMRIEGCYTHFASAGRHFLKNVQSQKERFDQALEELRQREIPCGLVHASASRTLAELGDLGYDAVRVGSLLLGREAGVREMDFCDAVWMEAKIVQKRWYPAGERLGYAGEVKLKRDSVVGVVPAGCADGLGVGKNREETIPALLRLRARQIAAGRRAAGPIRAWDETGAEVPVLDARGMNHTLVDLTGTRLETRDVIRFRVNPLLVNQRVRREVR